MHQWTRQTLNYYKYYTLPIQIEIYGCAISEGHMIESNITETNKFNNSYFGHDSSSIINGKLFLCSSRSGDTTASVIIVGK